MYVPLEQRDKIDELLSRYSPNYEYYEVYAYPSKKLEFGKWEFSYDYALLLDILKRDARTPMKEIEEALGKKETNNKVHDKQAQGVRNTKGLYDGSKMKKPTTEDSVE
ncbi:hypothetical protein [Thermococcus bergensis]|uniref:hypothetical protein n=1 Tax=Thermococcus bergensis TaxID=2689387 RepID=UPI001CEC799C|nr:hypothetical protein [Thermococcus bergensis]